MENYCGANCARCPSKEKCKGCLATGGSPFGGRCIAAQYVKTGGLAAYREFKEKLLTEANALLASLQLPPAERLYELMGSYVNLEYTLPSGEKVKFLNDRDIYLGAQIECAGLDVCFGVIADPSFILICSYGEGSSNPELILYQKR